MNTRNATPISSAPQPYGSARDLPSFREMEESIQGMKLLTMVVARDKRAELLRLEKEIDHFADVVDRFYACLGPRNWIFHELLNLSQIEGILNQSSDAEEAEKQLIAVYQDQEATRFWYTRLRNVPGLRERFHQIERARKHYVEGEFDSCVLQLIAVMDGYVNDFEPEVRKGLAARNPGDMAAWDNVVGHHMGLTNVLKNFTKTFKRRVDDEVFEVYRHGFVHGSIVRYDNVIVATKAWNMLFSVVDWGSSTAKSRQPVKQQPSLVDTMGKLVATARMKKQLAEWKRVSYSINDRGFADHELFRLTNEFLAAWHESNFGALAALQTGLLRNNKTMGQVAGELRTDFEGYVVSDFQVMELENQAPAIWLSRGTATVNGQSGSFECRWHLEDANGESAFGSSTGAWRLVNCGPYAWRRG